MKIDAARPLLRLCHVAIEPFFDFWHLSRVVLQVSPPVVDAIEVSSVPGLDALIDKPNGAAALIAANLKNFSDIGRALAEDSLPVFDMVGEPTGRELTIFVGARRGRARHECLWGG